MKKNCIFRAALSFMAAALVLSSCTKEDIIPDSPETTEAVAGVTIPYTVTVSGEPETRATVDGDMKTLRFAEGDKLYIFGPQVRGVLDIQTGVGEASGATFSGNLTYMGKGNMPDDFVLFTTLVSAQQTVGKEVSVNEKGAVRVNYPKNEYCATLDEAVQRYSDLSGIGVYSMKSLALYQYTSFLNFELVFEDGTPADTEIPAVVTVDSAKGLLRSGIVTTRDEGGKVVAKFVLPQAISSTLNNASVKLGTRDAIPFGTSGQTLSGKVYNVKKTVKYSGPISEDPLTVQALTAGTVKVDINGTLSTGMKYSVNGGEKTLITTTTDIPVSAGDRVRFYGNGTATQVYGDSPKVSIRGSGDGFTCKAYGNVMSLLDETNFATKTDLPNERNVFSGLFSGNTALTDAGDLQLPATKLTERCYEGMFALCFALTTAPVLPAETLASYCYFGMFRNCTALTAAPKLPATVLAEGCYTQMFQACTALTKAPDLLAPTLVQHCYAQMFENCTSLNSVKCLATSGIAENNSTYLWLSGVAPTGTLYCADGIIWKKGSINGGIPHNWTGRYPDGTIMSNPFPMAQVISEDIGKVIGTDGLVYETKASAAHLGITAVAVIVMTPPAGNRTAISIEDENCWANWYTAKSFCEGKTAPGSGATWFFPSVDHWKAVFNANGGSQTSCTGVNSLFTKAGGKTLSASIPYWTSTLHYGRDPYSMQCDENGHVEYERIFDKNGHKLFLRAFLVW